MQFYIPVVYEISILFNVRRPLRDSTARRAGGPHLRLHHQGAVPGNHGWGQVGRVNIEQHQQK